MQTKRKTFSIEISFAKIILVFRLLHGLVSFASFIGTKTFQHIVMAKPITYRKLKERNNRYELSEMRRLQVSFAFSTPSITLAVVLRGGGGACG